MIHLHLTRLQAGLFSAGIGFAAIGVRAIAGGRETVGVGMCQIAGTAIATAIGIGEIARMRQHLGDLRGSCDRIEVLVRGIDNAVTRNTELLGDSLAVEQLQLQHMLGEGQ